MAYYSKFNVLIFGFKPTLEEMELPVFGAGITRSFVNYISDPGNYRKLTELVGKFTSLDDVLRHLLDYIVELYDGNDLSEEIEEISFSDFYDFFLERRDECEYYKMYYTPTPRELAEEYKTPAIYIDYDEDGNKIISRLYPGLIEETIEKILKEREDKSRQDAEGEDA